MGENKQCVAALVSAFVERKELGWPWLSWDSPEDQVGLERKRESLASASQVPTCLLVLRFSHSLPRVSGLDPLLTQLEMLVQPWKSQGRPQQSPETANLSAFHGASRLRGVVGLSLSRCPGRHCCPGLTFCLCVRRVSAAVPRCQLGQCCPRGAFSTGAASDRTSGWEL